MSAMTDTDRLITPACRSGDFDAALHPRSRDDFVGRKVAK
jgi:hypothetical protein